MFSPNSSSHVSRSEVDSPVLVGFLLKWSVPLARWQRRLFVLRHDGCLLVYLFSSSLSLTSPLSLRLPVFRIRLGRDSHFEIRRAQAEESSLFPSFVVENASHRMVLSSTYAESLSRMRANEELLIEHSYLSLEELEKRAEYECLEWMEALKSVQSKLCDASSSDCSTEAVSMQPESPFDLTKAMVDPFVEDESCVNQSDCPSSLSAEDLEATRRQQRLKFITNGSYLLKYPYHRAHPHYRFVRYDDVDQCLHWGPHPGKATSHLLLDDIRWISFGPFSKAFQQNLAFLTDKSSQRCFSIVTATRTVDFMGDTDFIVEMWYLGLQDLLHERMVAAGRPIFSRARFIFKRVALRIRESDQCKRSFGQLVVDAMRKTIPDERRYEFELKLLFEAFDRDGTGALNQLELISFFRDLGQDVDDEKFSNAFENLDADHDGVITFGEFLQAANDMFSLDNLSVVATIRNVFNRYDSDRNNRIEPHEVRLIFRTIEGRDMPEEFLRQFLELTDPDGKGYITWPDFLKYAIRNMGAFVKYHHALGVLR